MSQQRTVKITQLILPATSLKNRETNVTASSGKAEREVNDIMENRTNKRREPIVVFMGHSDSEELSKDESSELPKFTTLPFFALNPKIRSSKRQENDDVMFLAILTNMSQKTFWINFGLIRP